MNWLIGSWKKISVFIGITILFYATLFLLLQHKLRDGANEIPDNTASEFKRLLGNGDHLYPALAEFRPIELDGTAGTFIMIYDSTGTAIINSARLHKIAPMLARSALLQAKVEGRNALTWQPKKGVREAVVIMPYSGPYDSGYIAVGQSLKAAEQQIRMLKYLLPLAAILTVILGLFFAAIYSRFMKWAFTTYTLCSNRVKETAPPLVKWLRRYLIYVIRALIINTSIICGTLLRWGSLQPDSIKTITTILVLGYIGLFLTLETHKVNNIEKLIYAVFFLSCSVHFAIYFIADSLKI